GFSAIEMMVVILIFCILMAAVLIPAYMRMEDKARDTQSRSNAVNLQKMVELYRMSNFKYPSSMADLDADATERNYNMELTNPYTGARGPIGSSKWAVKIADEHVPLPGFVGYKVIDTGHYEIYAFDRDGNLLKDVT